MMAGAKHNTRVELTEEEQVYVKRIAKYYANEMRQEGIMTESYKRDGTPGVNVVGTLRFALWKLAQRIPSSFDHEAD